MGQETKVIFQGERMSCVLCGREERSDPDRELNWRAVVMDDQQFYACPDEFSSDRASSTQFRYAYMRFFCACLHALNGMEMVVSSDAPTSCPRCGGDRYWVCLGDVPQSGAGRGWLYYCASCHFQGIYDGLVDAT